MKKVFFVMVLLLTLSFRIEAQKTLTLDEAISTALNESYSIKSAEQTLISSQKNLESIKMGLRSSVDFEFDIPRYSRSLSSQFNPLTGTEQFFTVGNTTVEGRLSINQPILFTNGTVSIVSSIFGRDQFADMSGTTRDYFSNLSIRLNQPLFTFNSQLGNLERAEINLEKTKRNYSRAEREIIYNVTASFYNLYKAKKSVEITEEKVKQTEDSYTTAMNKFKAGLIAEVEALQLEVDYAASKNELLNVKQIYEEAKNDFKLLIGLNINEDVDILAQLEYSPLELNIDDAVKSALNNRPEV
ncbi:MAG: TolC family protein, partial [Melioribacteraceae bacterium]